MKDKTETSSFEKEGASWYKDRYTSARVERNRYFVLLIICLIALIVSVAANLMLSPLKTAVPYVVEINKVDGSTSVLKPVDTEQIERNPSVTLYFLQKYLNARMSYSYGLRQVNADTVRALSTAQVYQRYARQVDASNPSSPVRLYRDNQTVNLKLLGFSFPYPDIAQVNFYTEVIDAQTLASQPSTRKYWQAIIKFTYSTVALPESERVSINPIGFFVTDFQLNEQIMPDQESN